VRGAEALRELQRESRRFLRRERALPDAFRERRALEELGDDVRLALPASDVVDVENVRMIEGARRARLLLEPAQRLFAAEAGDEHLDRDLAAELVVEGDHDPAHAALPQLALDLVSPGDEQRRARLVVQTAPRVQPLLPRLSAFILLRLADAPYISVSKPRTGPTSTSAARPCRT